MLDTVTHLLGEKGISSHLNTGITVVTSHDQEAGFTLAKEMLYRVVDKKTALFLSGGRTPKELYASLAKEEQLIPGAVGLVDERYGQKMHESSNEKMIKDSGFLRYLQMRDIPFYPILPSTPHLSSFPKGEGIDEETAPSPLREKVGMRGTVADEYDQQLRTLFNIFSKSVAILGIGLDGHTAGIAGNRPDFHNPLFDQNRKYLYVSEFDDTKGMFRERITMTFLGLSMMDFLLVLVFGADKKPSLEQMLADGSEEEVPARFLKRPDIAVKTLLITDQQIAS